MKKRVLFIPLLLGVASVAHGERLEERPDSLTNVLGLDLSRDRLEELPGTGISEFQLHTQRDSTSIVFRRGERWYVYTLAGSDHVEAATVLWSALEKNGLDAFVAKRDVRRRPPFSETADAVAIRMRSKPLH